MKYKVTLEKRKKDGVVVDENVPIRITINHNGKRVTLSTGYRTNFKTWNDDKKTVKQGYINKNGEPYNLINSKLKEQTSFIDNYALKHELNKTEPDLDELKIEFAEEFARKKNVKHKETPKELSFFDVFDLFVQKKGQQNSWTEATKAKMSTMKTKLETFDRRLTFAALNEDKLMEYALYLLEIEELRNSTTKKYIKNLKWFLNWAYDNGYYQDTSFKNFDPKLKLVNNDVIYLTKEELEAIRTCDIPKEMEYLSRLRDVFLFACYTGLRYSDVYKLKRNNIINERITYITKKTHDKLGSKLSSNALAILEKYKNVDDTNAKALPVISNQKMNDYLKDLCELAEINTPIHLEYFKGNKRIEENTVKHKLITTHTARRTFICNALANGMPPHAVMKLTGHSDYKAMQPYIDIVGKDLDDMVDKYLDF